MVKFAKENYLTVMREINAMNYDMTIAQEQTITLSSPLYPLSEKTSTVITSRITYNSLALPLANAPYSIELGYFNDPITGTTDENGYLEVTNLPKSTYLSLVFNFEKNGLQYNSSYSFSLPYNDLPSVLSIVPEIKTIPLLITGTNLVDEKGVAKDDFDPNTNIIVNFNLPVNTEIISENDIYLNGWNVNVINTIWSNNNQKLEIITEGLEYNSYYYLQLNLMSDTEFPQQLYTQLNFETKAQ